MEVDRTMEECSGSDRTMEECNGSGPYNGRVQWKWTVQWKSAMKVDRTTEECNESGPYNGRVQ